jgi:hypothetical protein
VPNNISAKRPFCCSLTLAQRLGSVGELLPVVETFDLGIGGFAHFIQSIEGAPLLGAGVTQGNPAIGLLLSQAGLYLLRAYLVEYLAGIQEHRAASDVREVMVDFIVFHLAALGYLSVNIDHIEGIIAGAL